ncbi:ERMES complex Ca(2+)-binding regulatory GTPase gem1 [Tulasnella sp. 418]|nr:ERMES complex Ca(2+)-binding regulatory GTPase gem1 [Tulasnella sp. 418]
MRRDVRIVLVGDEGVGKSTIVTTLIKESFIANVQHVVPEVTIPPEVTPEKVTTHIIDTSPGPQDRPHLDTELRKAHAICLVYAIDNPNSFDRIPAYWLPYFRSLGVNLPVILVGNKIDLRGGEVTNQALEDEIMPIMNEFKEVETCVECSARTPVNISEIFFFAQKAVLHPTAPLYDSREHILKPACVAALKRIFKLCDVNKDGVLDAAELNEFQRKCFGTPLQLSELQGIKETVRAHVANGVGQGVLLPVSPVNSPSQSPPEEGLTEAGFLYLHTTFIQRGRLETTWTVLRKFGYAEDLKLQESFLEPKFEVPYDCSVELSPLGYQFFTDIFEVYDKDQDGALKQEELDDLFSTSPGCPWSHQGFPDTTIADDSGAVTLQGWLAQWSMTTLLDYKTTLAYLAYLGYPLIPVQPLSSSYLPPPQPTSTTTALQISRPRKTDRKRGKVSRNVFLCYICGAAGSGKTSLLRSFVGKKFVGRSGNRGAELAYEPTTKVISVVNSVEIGGSEKYLVLQEFGSKYEAEVLKNKKAEADMIVYVYDSSDTNSFSYISNLRQQYSLDHLPSFLSAIPGGADRANALTTRLGTYATFTALLGGTTAMIMYLTGFRTAAWRPGLGPVASTSWWRWLFGRGYY